MSTRWDDEQHVARPGCAAERRSPELLSPAYMGRLGAAQGRSLPVRLPHRRCSEAVAGASLTGAGWQLGHQYDARSRPGGPDHRPPGSACRSGGTGLLSRR